VQLAIIAAASAAAANLEITDASRGTVAGVAPGICRSPMPVRPAKAASRARQAVRAPAGGGRVMAVHVSNGGHRLPAGP
jgi:hypothetical protein